MLYESIMMASAVAGVGVGAAGAYYGWRQYLIARRVARQSEDRPTEPDQPPVTATGETTPLGYVTLGEFVWYLCYPPATTPSHLFKGINNFLKHLETCGLKDTRAAAAPLESIQLLYHAAPGVVTPESRLRLADVMLVVKSSLENELAKGRR
jgi:hypothetical protein